MKLANAMDEYLLACRAKGTSPHTMRWYEQKLSIFRAFLKTELDLTHVEGLAPRHINLFAEHLKSTPSLNGRGVRSTYTVKGYIECVKNLLSWLEDEDLIDAKVRARVVLPKVQKKVIKTISPEQFERLMRATSQEPRRDLQLRDQAILCLLLATGIRASELCGLHVEHVHFGSDDSYITVLGKGNKQREVGPLGVKAQTALRRYFRGHDGSLAFHSRRAVPFTPNGLDQMLKRLRDWAGVEHFGGIRVSAHTLRHTFAVTFLKQGGDLKRLQLLLGHTSLAVTQRYLEDFQQRDARSGHSVLDDF